MRSISDFTDVGTVTTAAPDVFAFTNLLRRCGSKGEERSHSKVATCGVNWIYIFLLLCI